MRDLVLAPPCIHATTFTTCLTQLILLLNIYETDNINSIINQGLPCSFAQLDFDCSS